MFTLTLFFLHLVFLIVVAFCVSGHQSGFCMICVMQNHIIQAFANTGNAIKPVSFIRDLKSKPTRFRVNAPKGSEQKLLFQCIFASSTNLLQKRVLFISPLSQWTPYLAFSHLLFLSDPIMADSSNVTFLLLWRHAGTLIITLSKPARLRPERLWAMSQIQSWKSHLLKNVCRYSGNMTNLKVINSCHTVLCDKRPVTAIQKWSGEAAPPPACSFLMCCCNHIPTSCTSFSVSSPTLIPQCPLCLLVTAGGGAQL